MIRIFDDSCVHILQINDGFIASFKSEDKTNLQNLQFKRISVLNDTAREIDPDQFKLLKFGFDFDWINSQIDDYLFTLCRRSESGMLFTVSGEGAVKVFDKKGNLINQGDFCHQDCRPVDIAIGDGVIWASYPELNTIVRYNISSLRQELRIGGMQSKVLNSPCGLLLQGQQLYICNAASNKILLMDTANFTVQEHLSFDEPVYEFIKIEGFNIVRLKSGVYRV